MGIPPCVWLRVQDPLLALRRPLPPAPPHTHGSTSLRHGTPVPVKLVVLSYLPHIRLHTVIRGVCHAATRAQEM